MMIPPHINVGKAPPRECLQHPRQELVVLVENRGWCIAKYDRYGPALVDEDTRIPQYMRLIHPESVLCWMTQDGS